MVGMRLELLCGAFATIGEHDAILVAGRNWRIKRDHRNGRVAAVAAVSNGKLVYLHRLIMRPDEGLVVDHINGDPLDNRRRNLRICTHAENMRNRKVHRDNTSGVRGVYLRMRAGRAPRWCAQIRGNGRKIFLGEYKSKEDAAAAYMAASKKFHGEFARAA